MLATTALTSACAKDHQEVPALVTSVSPSAPAACSTTSFRKAIASTGLPLAQVRISICRGRYAYVNFQGPGIGVHGNQDVLFEKQGDAWKAIAWGETSQGRFVAETLTARGLDARKIAALFPEAAIHVPPAPPTGEPGVPTKHL